MSIKTLFVLTLILACSISSHTLSQEQSSVQKLTPLEDAMRGGASLSYLALRCSGLYVSVLALDLPRNLKSIRPKLENRFATAYEVSLEIREDKADVSEAAARELIRDDIQTFADKYVQVWNSNYVQSGQYLGETFTEDAAFCELL